MRGWELYGGEGELHHLAPAELFNLTGRVALVAGAGGGIGSRLAAGFAVAGAELALSDVYDETLQTAAAKLPPITNYQTYTTDLSEVAACRRLADTVAKDFGRLDILVNCAGFNIRRPILDVTEDDYESLLAVNLRAPFFLSQTAARHMIDRGRAGRLFI